jgi:hypothetical protein
MYSLLPISLSLSQGMFKDIQGCIATHTGLYVEYP